MALLAAGTCRKTKWIYYGAICLKYPSRIKMKMKHKDAFDPAPDCGKAAHAILVRRALPSTVEPHNLTGALETCET